MAWKTWETWEKELEATGYWIGNGIWTFRQETERRCRARTGPGMREIPAISMDKIVSLLQWHSFNSSAEKDSEKRACCAVNIPAFSHFQHTFMARAIQHSFIQSFEGESFRETRLLRSQMQSTSQHSRIFSIHSWPGPFHIYYSAYIHSILQEKSSEIHIQE